MVGWSVGLANVTAAAVVAGDLDGDVFFERDLIGLPPFPTHTHIHTRPASCCSLARSPPGQFVSMFLAPRYNTDTHVLSLTHAKVRRHNFHGEAARKASFRDSFA